MATRTYIEIAIQIYRILGGIVKSFDPQVLFDTFEEQLHLPTTLVQLSDNDCG